MFDFIVASENITYVVVEIVLMALVLLSIYWYRRPSKSPPGPRGIPLLGVAPFVGKYMERTMAKWKKTYGSIISVRLGRHDMVVLNDLESINQALVKQPTKFSGRALSSLFQEACNGDFGIGLLDYGPTWKSQRKFGLTTLRGFGVGKKSMESQVSEEITYLNEAIRSKHGKAFDISIILQKAVANSICRVIFGKRYDYDDKVFEKALHMLLTEFNDEAIALTTRVLFLAPWLRRVPPISSICARYIDNISIVVKFLQSLVDEHEQTFDKENLRDFIDCFLKEMKKGEDKSFTINQLIHYIRELFLAGTDTSTSTLNWALLCFLHYPEAQRKLRQEVFDVIGSSGAASMSHKSSMPYTSAFIQELMRYRTLSPLSVLHKANEDAELNGYVISKNTIVAPNIWAVHNDPEHWEEPEKFKPERFINEKGEFVSSSHVIPFSVGPRHCLGEQLARMEIFLFLVSMVQKFEFLPDPEAKELPDIDNGVSALVFVPYPYRLVANEI
ncbi:cytochrome P450 2J6-like [Clavelina lepadiformis]|uniref:cytochrome P450 2J6-like n=1 Tax=Clavelina lepadiformis TaxID=159417 RepID=UPI004042F87D